ncbi:MAG: 1-acyl-sn-glycerol-3-phosphate acyltransferase, partial [Candidatus Omnitrophica bacterium]|nr:1-acyl-sn-glycerol-3-phosphate acyltransferase [Candidatus Omnitrophota bacterium]
SKFLLWLFFRVGFGLEVVGQEHVPKRGAFLVASNHVSYLDPPLIGVACPRRLRFMARADLFRHLLLGAFLRGVHAIPLKREAGDIAAFRAALAALRGGAGVAIFPEGGRQLSGTPGAPKRGVGLLADAARVPVIPALVQGTFQALPPHERRLRRAKIRVAFGEPIPYTFISAPRRHEQVAEAVAQAWRRLAQQVNEQSSGIERTDPS